ncbi:rhodanese-like domain-containing protein [Ferrimonas gelatinilytica]|uniref:Rhodanese domain-containing protein n=1 Tax=Ferrimonas gelatinilytica TaxID=1255257 RepID=A0ABP9RU46_9GAMM
MLNKHLTQGALALLMATGALLPSALALPLAQGEVDSAATEASTPAPAPAAQAARQAWQWIQQGAVVIDVRSDEEFAQGHLSGAKHIPYDRIGEQIGGLSLSPDQPIVVYCRSGRRSGIAQATLEAMGYSQVHNGGGLETLRAERP